MGNNSHFSWKKGKQFVIFLYPKIRECKMGRWMGSTHNPRNGPKCQNPYQVTAPTETHRLQVHPMEKPQLLSNLCAMLKLLPN